MSHYLWKLKIEAVWRWGNNLKSQVKLFPPSNSTQNINQMGRLNKKENIFRKSRLPQVYFSYTLSQQITRGCAPSKWENKPKNLEHMWEYWQAMIPSCHLLFDHFQFALIHGPNVPGSYAMLLLTASNLASITSPIHNWVLFLLWLYPSSISPLISSSTLGTDQPGEFIFQYPIFLPFHTVHGVLKARILKWFAIPFSSGPHSVRALHHDPSVLSGPTWHGLVSLS